LIKSSQHGFVAKRSCLTNLLTFIDKVCCDVDCGLQVDVVYLDFKKAFDKVPHRRLLAKLEAHGIEGLTLRWIENWLSSREQRVVVNGYFSTWTSVESGVPQGSVLGPLLFLIYINDIDSGIINALLKFADDCKLFGCVTTAHELESMKADLATLAKWSKEWLMPFNISKCKVMHFGHNNQAAAYNIDGNDLATVTNELDLGVIVKNDLSVSLQCAKVVKTANRIIGLIKRTFTSRDEKVLLPLYKSLVRPHLEYCVQAWCPHLKKDIDLIENVQHRMTKLINGVQYFEYVDRLEMLNMTTLQVRRLRGDLIEVLRCLTV
jgi:hypothetical protein